MVRYPYIHDVALWKATVVGMNMAQIVGDEWAQEVRSHLERLLKSKDFDASKRNGQFLRFVVEAALKGEGDRIKAYTIATSVFGRDANFDPQTDSIVRIEARRLRRALEHYYLLERRFESLRIDIPTGSYIPEFRKTTTKGLVKANCLDRPRFERPNSSRTKLAPFAEGS
jgi:hypothetical protein